MTRMAITCGASTPSNPGDEAEPGLPQTGEDTCPACNGTGKDPNDSPCTQCRGTGIVIVTVGDA